MARIVNIKYCNDNILSNFLNLGDLLRAVIASGSGLGKKIKGVIDAGQVFIQNTGSKLNRYSKLY